MEPYCESGTDWGQSYLTAHRPCFGASSAPVIPSARYPCTTPVVGIYLPLALLTSLALAYLPFTVSMGLILSLVYSVSDI